MYSQSSLVSTTINSTNLYYYEMNVRKSIQNTNKYELVPVSCMLTNDLSSSSCTDQWLNKFTSDVKKIYCNYYLNDLKNNCEKQPRIIVCDNQMKLVESILTVYNKEDFISFSNRCFRLVLENNTNIQLSSHFKDINDHLSNELEYINTKNLNNNVFIHTCTDQLMKEISNLCKYYYSEGNNFNFGMYAFSVILNSQSLEQLQMAIYSFMCILYSKTINKIVQNSFYYLKSVLNSDQNQNKNNKSSNSEFYLYNFNAKKTETFQDENENLKTNDYCIDNIGLIALKPINRDRIFERTLDNINNQSLFYKMCEKLFEKCKYDVDECEKNQISESQNNPRMSHSLLYNFIRQFSASLPLWTRLLLNTNTPLTLKMQQERFNLLQSVLAPDNEEKDSLDVFIKRLFEENRLLIDENIKFYGINTLDVVKMNSTSSSTSNSPLNNLIPKNNSEFSVQSLNRSVVALNQNEKNEIAKSKTRNELLKMKSTKNNKKSSKSLTMDFISIDQNSSSNDRLSSLNQPREEIFSCGGHYSRS